MTPEQFAIARDSALARINRLVDNQFHLRGPDWVRTWYDLLLTWSEGEPAYVRLPERSVAELITKARDNRDIFELASFVAGTRLASGVPLPQALRLFVCDVLTGAQTPPPRPGGRPRRNTWGRDFIVADVVSNLKRGSDLPVSQNPERVGTDGYETTVSEIVEAAIAQSRLASLTRRQIEKIWFREDVQAQYREFDGLAALSLLYEDEEDTPRI